MRLSVSRGVREVIADEQAEELLIRVASKTPAQELLAAVQRALQSFERDWVREAPLTDPDGPLPPPDYAVVAAAPDVLISLVKLSDWPITFDRLLTALQDGLTQVTSQASLELPKKSRVTNDEPMSMLNLRVALRGSWINAAMFEVDPEIDLDMVQSTCISWARELDSSGEMHARSPNGRFAPVAVGSELNLARDSRADPFSCLVSRRGDHVRGMASWVSFGWISLLSGVKSDADFYWREHWSALDKLFRQLEPFTHMAILCHGTSIGRSAAATYSWRTLSQLPARARVTAPHAERSLEDHGLVDAEGRFFLPNPPGGLPAAWVTQPYGHLTQVDAPNIDSWLARQPSNETLTTGRNDLTPLLYRQTDC